MPGKPSLFDVKVGCSAFFFFFLQTQGFGFKRVLLKLSVAALENTLADAFNMEFSWEKAL